jgi:hypothetical protein
MVVNWIDPLRIDERVAGGLVELIRVTRSSALILDAHVVHLVIRCPIEFDALAYNRIVP